MVTQPHKISNKLSEIAKSHYFVDMFSRTIVKYLTENGTLGNVGVKAAQTMT